MAAVAAGAIPTAAAATHILQYLNPEEPPVSDVEFAAALEGDGFADHDELTSDAVDGVGSVSVTNFHVDQDAPLDGDSFGSEAEEIVIQRLDLSNGESALDLIDLEQSPVINIDEYDLASDDYNADMEDYDANEVVQTELLDPFDNQAEVEYLAPDEPADLSQSAQPDNLLENDPFIHDDQAFDYLDDNGIDHASDDPGIIYEA